MKTKHLLILATCLLVAVETFSQEDIRSEIMNYQESEFAFVNKARRLLGTRIKEGNIIEATKVKEALLDEFSGEISEVFYNYEYMHTLFALGEYYELLIFMKQFDVSLRVSQNVYTSSQTDNLGATLFENTMQYNDIIAIDINDQVESELERDFLLLLLKDISHYSNIKSEKEEHKKGINILANQFLTNYPDSPYDKFVRENIRLEYEEANWGFYWDAGFALSINDGKLGETIGTTGFGMEMNFEYRYKKVLGLFEIGFIANTLKEDIDINNTTWTNKSSSTLGTIALNAGYLLLENKRWSIYPLAGFGFGSITAASDDIKEDPNLKGMKLNTFYPQVGLGIDFKHLVPGIMEVPYGRISLKYKYKIFNLEKKHPLFQGNQHTITLTYGFGGRPAQRKL